MGVLRGLEETRLDVRFAVLGPVRVTAGDRELTGLAPRHRAVLAYLLLHSGAVLSADQLIDALWGRRRPTPRAPRSRPPSPRSAGCCARWGRSGCSRPGRAGT
ncbi:winged helix-turn-helix domain-containing protein [Nonomuraea antimicrobica]